MDPRSEDLTGFRTRQGSFVWKVLPFGLSIGPAWFQEYINRSLNELLDFFASAYADDILIWSNKGEDHWGRVEEVLFRLQKAGLQADIRKSQFGVTTIDYLGVILEAGVGISIDPRKIKSPLWICK